MVKIKIQESLFFLNYKKSRKTPNYLFKSLKIFSKNSRKFLLSHIKNYAEMNFSIYIKFFFTFFFLFYIYFVANKKKHHMLHSREHWRKDDDLHQKRNFFFKRHFSCVFVLYCQPTKYYISHHANILIYLTAKHIFTRSKTKREKYCA